MTPLIATPAIPVVVGLALIVLGRLGRGVPERPAAALSCAAAALSACCAVLVAVERPGVAVSWLPELGLSLDLGVDDLARVVLPALALAMLGVLLGLAGSDPGPRRRCALAGCVLLVFGVALAVTLVQNPATAALVLTGIVLPGWALVRMRSTDNADDRADSDDSEGSDAPRVRLADRLVLQHGVGTGALLAATLTAGSSLGRSHQTVTAALLLLAVVVLLGLPPVPGVLPRLWGTVPVPVLITLTAVPALPMLVLVLRLGWSAAPSGMETVAPVLLVLGALALLGGGLLALAYGADREDRYGAGWVVLVQHGLLAIALATGTVAGAQAAVVAALAGVAVVAVLAPAVEFGGRALVALAVAAVVAVPGTAMFWPRVTTVVALWSSPAQGEVVLAKVVAVVVIAASVLLAAWGVRALLAVAARSAAENPHRRRPTVAVAAAMAVVVVLGCAPTAITHLLDGDLVQLLGQVTR